MILSLNGGCEATAWRIKLVILEDCDSKRLRMSVVDDNNHREKC